MPRRLIALALIAMLLLVSGCGAAVQFDTASASPAAAPAAGTPGAGTPATAGEAESCARTLGACTVEALLINLVDYLTLLAELCGAFVIAVGVLRGILRFVPRALRPERDDGTYKEDIRLQLGKSLALALEFATGADILKTAVAPTFPIIAQLAAIIVLRTALNYFLERELREVERRRANLHLEREQPDARGAGT